MELNKVEIDRIRRKAYRHGFRIEKSRQRSTHSNNGGGLMLIEGWSNTPLAGLNFELDTAQTDYWIDRYASEGRGNGSDWLRRTRKVSRQKVAFPPSLKKIIGAPPRLSRTLSDYPLGPDLVLSGARRADLRKCRKAGNVPELSRTNLLQRLENRLRDDVVTVGAVFSEGQLVDLWIPASNIRPGVAATNIMDWR